MNAIANNESGILRLILDEIRLLRDNIPKDSLALRYELNLKDTEDLLLAEASNPLRGMPAENVRSMRKSAPCLPDPRLVRDIIRQRRLRSKFFPPDLFGDPTWDMLLDLTAARAEFKRVSVTSLCIASGVPPTTALRWINVMVDRGLLERVEDDQDGRRTFIALADAAARSMAQFFAQLVEREVSPI